MSGATLETNRVAALEPDVKLEGFSQRGSINISVETVNEATASLPDDQRNLVRWLYGLTRENHWGWTELAQQTGISHNTLYKVWNGKYKDAEGKPVKLDNICEDIERYRRLVNERQEIAPFQFVETSVSKRIFKICDEARIMQTVALVFGDGQIGKTTGAIEYKNRNNHGQTIYYRTPASSSEFFPGLARASYISPKNSTINIRQKLFRAFDHSKLLILDELHLVFEIYTPRAIMRTMETIRELHDRTGCGLVLFGTNVFRDEMDIRGKGEYAKMLQQLRRRGILELQLPAVAPRADIDAIAASYHLKPATGDAADLAKLITAQDGLGRFCKYLQKAQQMAAKNKQSLSWEHFVKVHLLITKMSVFQE